MQNKEVVDNISNVILVKLRVVLYSTYSKKQTRQ